MEFEQCKNEGFKLNAGKKYQYKDRFTKKFKKITIHGDQLATFKYDQNGEDDNQRVWKQDAKFTCKMEFPRSRKKKEKKRDMKFEINYKPLLSRNCKEWVNKKKQEKKVCIFRAKENIDKGKDFNEDNWEQIGKDIVQPEISDKKKDTIFS